MQNNGIHLLAEFWYCDAELLNNQTYIGKILVEAAEIAGATVIKSMTHSFAPQGVTGLVLLAESHISLHSWPETEYAAVDVFTCGTKIDPYRAVEYLKTKLNVGQDHVVTHMRGMPEDFDINDIDIEELR